MGSPLRPARGALGPGSWAAGSERALPGPPFPPPAPRRAGKGRAFLPPTRYMLAAMSARPPAEPEPSPARRRRLSLDRRRRRRLATGEGEGRGGDTEGGGCARPQRRPRVAERAPEAGARRGRGDGLRGPRTSGPPALASEHTRAGGCGRTWVGTEAQPLRASPLPSSPVRLGTGSPFLLLSPGTALYV